MKNHLALHLILTFSLFLILSCKKSGGKIELLGQTEDYFVYKSYNNTIVAHEIKKDVEPFQYDKDLFRYDKKKKSRARIIYDDPNYTVRYGLDISRHDGKPINWKKVRADGWDFIIFRIGWRGYQSGILHVDEHFHENIQGALKEDFDIGVYVFSQAITEEEALEEAELVINELKDYKITLPVVFDPESIPWEEARTDEISGDQFTKNTIAFCNRIKEAGYEPMIYSNLNWETRFFDLSQLKEYKIWFADYQNPPTTPYHFEYWQYGGEIGKIPGIPGKRRVDVDIMLVPNN